MESSTGKKIVLSTLFLFLFVILGMAYQYYYLEERGEYERAIRQHYVAEFASEPDPAELRHFAIIALDRHGPTEFYRTEEDYRRLFEDEWR